MGNTTRRWPAAVACAGVLLSAGIAISASPLRRDLDDYVILGMQQVRLKNMFVEAPGCNIGTNCPTSSGSCGVLRSSGAFVAEPGQIVSDQLCGEGEFWELFRNNSGCNPDCGSIANPGSGPQCEEPFAPPILADFDMDGNPSCGPACDIDYDDVAAACGTTLPFPACDKSTPVVASRGEDCTPSSLDVNPGNGECDLAAGAYGLVRVQSGANLRFGAGETAVCKLVTGKAVRIRTAGPATVLVPGRGGVRLSNLADVSAPCRQLKLITERGTLKFGKHGDFNLDACSVFGKVKLGHDNNLRGRFIGGKSIGTDLNTDARCCEGPPTTTTLPTTTTTSSSSSTSSTTSSSTSSSTTSSTSSTTSSSTTTTDPGGSSSTTSTSSTTSSSSSSTTTTSSSSTTSTSTSSSTTTTSSSTTSTTAPTGGFTRSVGFYKAHPDVSGDLIDGAGGITVCGIVLTNVGVDHAQSAIEAMCTSPQGDPRVQLVRQLTAAAISMAGGGATFPSFATCDALCTDPGASSAALSACSESVENFNLSGEGFVAPFDPPPSATTGPCQQAHATPCTVLDPGSCSLP